MITRSLSALSMAAPALVLVLAGGAARADVQSFEVDPHHTVIGFRASTVLFDVTGRFNRYKVQISGDPASGKDARVRVEIDAKSVDTGNTGRDKHLRSDDFFAAERFPKIVFTSDSVTREGDKVVVKGTLDMHGVKRPLTLPFASVTATNGAGVMEHVYKLDMPISRKDFGVGADSVAAKISMKDEVQLTLLLAGFFEAPKAAKK